MEFDIKQNTSHPVPGQKDPGSRRMAALRRGPWPNATPSLRGGVGEPALSARGGWVSDRRPGRAAKRKPSPLCFSCGTENPDTACPIDIVCPPRPSKYHRRPRWVAPSHPGRAKPNRAFWFLIGLMSRVEQAIESLLASGLRKSVPPQKVG